MVVHVWQGSRPQDIMDEVQLINFQGSMGAIPGSQQIFWPGKLIAQLQASGGKVIQVPGVFGSGSGL